MPPCALEGGVGQAPGSWPLAPPVLLTGLDSFLLCLLQPSAGEVYLCSRTCIHPPADS